MALRLMQVLLPIDAEGDLEDLLEERKVMGRWHDSDGSRLVVHLLVPAEQTEPIMDRFEQRFGGVEGFHIVLVPVEAVLPRPKPEDGQGGDGSNGNGNGGEPDANGNNDDNDVDDENTHRVSREELYAEVTEGLGVTRVYVSLTVLSAVVASVGLMRDDVAVIIGAMVIAPLLGPNVALALGTALGDVALIRRAAVTGVVGVAAAFGLAVGVGLAFDVSVDVPSIASRTRVGAGDILLALSAGAAGTLAFTTGLAGAVIGVMVAVALVPPLVVCGMLVGEGLMIPAIGAFLLTAANIIAINLSGVAVFVLQGVRPRSWWEARRARAATQRAAAIWAALLALLVLILWLTRQ